MATRGASQSVSLEIAVPLSDLEFYKLNYRGEIYFPLFGEFTLHLRGELGYGDGYGDTTELPFYEHFFAGGFGSVRGYEVNTLGPRATEPIVYTANTAATAIDENGRPHNLAGLTVAAMVIRLTHRQGRYRSSSLTPETDRTLSEATPL